MCACAGEFPRQVWFSIKRHDVRELCEPLAAAAAATPSANSASSAGLPNGLRHKKDEGQGQGQELQKTWVLRSDEWLSRWLQDTWARKEKLLYETYAALGLHRALPHQWSTSADAANASATGKPMRPAELVDPWWVRPTYLFYLIYWACFLVIAWFLITRSSAFCWYLGIVSVASIGVTIFFGGTDKLQIYLCNPGYKTAEVPDRVIAHLPSDVHADADYNDNQPAAADYKSCNSCCTADDCNGAPSSSSPMPSPPLDMQKGLNASLEDTERALRLRTIDVAQH